MALTSSGLWKCGTENPKVGDFDTHHIMKSNSEFRMQWLVNIKLNQSAN